uniref:BTB domain-containing protein n=1 Tax=Panagrellus redivivus TaxID=6233 RepID=A0A7E4USV7_PANRE
MRTPDAAPGKTAIQHDQIIHLNVGGQRFSTSKSTLTWVRDTFFTSLLSGRIATIEDESGAKFIDRDPILFRYILNYLRTQQIDLNGVSIPMLRHEAQFYGIGPLVKRLTLCEEMNESVCGDVLYHGRLDPPMIPHHEEPPARRRNKANSASATVSTSSISSNRSNGSPSPRFQHELSPSNGHHKKLTYELTKQVKSELSQMMRENMAITTNPLRVRIIRAHHNSVAVAYGNFVACYKMKEHVDWQLFYTTPRMPAEISHISLMAKFASTPEKLAVALTDNSVYLWGFEEQNEEVIVAKLGTFTLEVRIDQLSFIGNQLVALSKAGKVGIWHSMTQNWQVQDVIPISCSDTAGSMLLLGCTNGSIYYIDMQKFPLRMKDNDLLITELYKDPNSDVITAISVYLTPKTNICGNWIEIAYGTSNGTVRVIVQHPETVGHGPQLFQTFTVHTSPITRVALTTNHLISVCSEYNHVRSWSVTRFRGMISTQPGGTSLASFKVMTLDSVDDDSSSALRACDPGPYGDQDTEQLFIQRLVPDAHTLFVRLASTGDRVCTIKSVDQAAVTEFYAHECEVPNRMGARPRRYLFTGSDDGSVQIWDLTTALDQHNSKIQNLANQMAGVSAAEKTPTSAASTAGAGTSSSGAIVNTARVPASARFAPILQGPTPEELLQIIDGCELCCASLNNTPTLTPQSSLACLATLEKQSRCD